MRSDGHQRDHGHRGGDPGHGVRVRPPGVHLHARAAVSPFEPVSGVQASFHPSAPTIFCSTGTVFEVPVLQKIVVALYTDSHLLIEHHYIPGNSMVSSPVINNLDYHRNFPVVFRKAVHRHQPGAEAPGQPGVQPHLLAPQREPAGALFCTVRLVATCLRSASAEVTWCSMGIMQHRGSQSQPLICCMIPCRHRDHCALGTHAILPSWVART